jgi:hypothetical protein
MLLLDPNLYYCQSINWKLVGWFTNTISAGGVTLNSTQVQLLQQMLDLMLELNLESQLELDIVLWSGNAETPAVNSACESGQAGFK